MGELNHEAWARSMIGFIRERGLESEFKDWCGGWPCRVESPAMHSGEPAVGYEELLAVIYWYADQFCELGPYTEACGKLESDACSGCKARAVLARARHTETEASRE